VDPGRAWNFCVGSLGYLQIGFAQNRTTSLTVDLQEEGEEERSASSLNPDLVALGLSEAPANIYCDFLKSAGLINSVLPTACRCATLAGLDIVPH